MRRSGLPQLAVAYAVAQAALIAAYRFLPQSAQAAVYAGSALAAAAMVLVGARRRDPGAARHAWYLIALGLGVFAVSDIAFNFSHLGDAASDSGTVDGYALGYVFLIAGLLFLVKLTHGGWERMLLVEIAILAVALTLVQWFVIADFGEPTGGMPKAEFARVFAYGLADAALLACAEHAVIAAGRRAPAVLAVFGATLALLVGDEGYAFAPSAYALGSWPDLAWLVSYALFATAALSLSAGRLAAPATPQLGMPVARLASLGVALLALPALVGLSVAPGVEAPMHAVLATGGLLIVALVLIRISSLVGSVVRAQGHELEARRRAETARNQLATLIGSLQAGVLLEGVDGAILITNEAFCRIFDFERSPEDLVGSPAPHTRGGVASLVAEPDAFARRAAELTRDRRLVRGELVELLDGRSFLRDHIPVFRAGRYEGSLWHYLDVTEKQRAEIELAEARDEAVEATRLKSEFLAVMSHEIRTPMHGVIGATDLLESTALDTEQRELTNVLRDSAEALLSLLDDILDFSRIEADKLAIVEEEVDLAALVDATLDALAPEARRKGIWLSAHVSGALPARVRADSLRLRQILVNLVGNSLKFTPAGEVAVRLEPEPAGEGRLGLRLTVSDTGVGIPKEAEERLFEPFTQFDSSRTRSEAGTGLGLAICTRLAELMDGSLAFESEPGVGTAMTAVVFVGRSPGALARATEPGLSGRAVLVGDAHLTLANLAATLEEAGMATTRCPTEAADEQAVRDAVVVLSTTRGTAFGGAPTIELSTVPGVRPDGGPPRIVLPAGRTRLLAAVDRVVRGSAATPPVQPARRVAQPPQLGLGAVLVVEDNEINRKLTMRQLARLGVTARAVASGDEALTALHAGAYGAVLMDCRMPGMDGFAATRAIRAREAETGDHVPVIAITADAQHRDRQACLEAGMDDYLTKPLRLEELGSCLRRWLEHDVPTAPPPGLHATGLLAAEVGDAAAADLVRLWLERLPDQLAAVRTAVEREDAEAAAAAAHVLKSTSAALGADPTAELAGRLESSARRKRLAGADTIVAELLGAAARDAPELEARLAALEERH